MPANADGIPIPAVSDRVASRQPLAGHRSAAHKLAGPHFAISPRHATKQLVELYRLMRTARMIDAVEAELVAAGETFFHVASRGHEGSAILAEVLLPQDWVHSHYRGKALMLARGIEIEQFFHGSLSTAQSHSAGRQMSDFFSDPERRILSTVTPVGNNTLQSVGIAAACKHHDDRPIVLCGIGDGSTQQGEVLEAISEAVREQLPVVFWIEDNGLAISTKTRGRTFYDLPSGPADNFLGVDIYRVNGSDPFRALPAIKAAIDKVRSTRGPTIIVFRTERLSNHSNADDERDYRDHDEILAARKQSDPVLNVRRQVLESGLSEQSLADLEADIESEVRAASLRARCVGDPKPTTSAKKPLPPELTDRTREYPPAGSRIAADAGDAKTTMLEAIQTTLRNHLQSEPRVILLGEDIEDPKGDVFRVTRGLSTAFPGRVLNTALSETTIIGSSIGRAMVGQRPVAFIQFADFLPVTLNQLMAELGTMYWRSNGGWQCPVIVMAACGGYRPGLGPFHAQTMEAVIAHTPGIDLMMPSHAADAAGMLNQAFQSERPTVFLYPKTCLNDVARATTSNIDRHFAPSGTARQITSGNDLTLVTWGSTVSICERVVAELIKAGAGVDLFDLRTLSPWDRETVCESANRTGRLLCVHEDNITCGFGAEVLATVGEAALRQIDMRRLARPDTPVPFNFANQLELLPSFKKTLAIASDMVELDLSWSAPNKPAKIADFFEVNAVGSSPADQAITIIEWRVAPGERVTTGQHIADVEAEKAVFDVSSPRDGIVHDMLVANGESVPIGEPILRIAVTETGDIRERVSMELHGTPQLTRRPSKRTPQDQPTHQQLRVGIATIGVCEGSERLDNKQMALEFPGRTADEILRLTGVESRPRLAKGESAITLAITAAQRALDALHLTANDLDAIICSTTTPTSITPSMASLVLSAISPDGDESPEIPSFDISAACTGYLYGLASGFDIIRDNPSARVMVVTTEAMSTVIDPNDFSTAILFGDAATATIIHGPALGESPAYWMSRPTLSGKTDDTNALTLPADGSGYLAMDGRGVFSEGVRHMAAILQKACGRRRADELDFVIPHQANSRIIDAVRKRANLTKDRVHNDMRNRGNTSSSSIPLALAGIGRHSPQPKTIGLCAFGGGFTFGAVVLTQSPTAIFT
ncbi:MAG: thiamine pyrophosphate-dependent enzyme [Planctomycetota bacterium]|nr:thiamine pyrophosphate-dependent enzyme [Planctomycetota bacterium]